MEMTGEQLLPVARERVWAALLDTEILRAAIPGCESITPEEGGAYRIVVVASVGPVKARFKGRLQHQDLQPPQRYTLSFEGDGGMAGFARGSAEVELSEGEDPRAQTRLAYRAQAQIGGRLAQIGSRLIDATAARLSAQFFERLTQVITAPPPEAAATTDTVVPATSSGTPTPARAPAPAPQPAVPTGAGALVTLQMPAWTWAFTVTVVALLSAWLATH